MDAHDFVSEKFDKIVRNSIDSVESSQPTISMQRNADEIGWKELRRTEKKKKKPKALCTNWLTKR